MEAEVVNEEMLLHHRHRHRQHHRYHPKNVRLKYRPIKRPHCRRRRIHRRRSFGDCSDTANGTTQSIVAIGAVGGGERAGGALLSSVANIEGATLATGFLCIDGILVTLAPLE